MPLKLKCDGALDCESGSDEILKQGKIEVTGNIKKWYKKSSINRGISKTIVLSINFPRGL